MPQAKAKSVSLETLVALAKRRGFIFQGSEIYGGLSGTWDYGPYGLLLKRNIMNLWWKMFVEEREDMLGVDAAIIMNQKVWQASGHTETFTDPLVECSNCHSRFRADKIDTKRCPTCGKEGTFGEPHQFNLLFNTHVGASWGSFEAPDGQHLAGDIKAVDNSSRHEKVMVPIKEGDTFDSVTVYEKRARTYLRPETAQGIFTNFKNVVDVFYPEVPFGIAQQGKAFRNEISPRDFVFRSREFEQMEIEYFIHPDEWEKQFESWRKHVHEWFKALGLSEEKIHELEVPAEDRAHYSKRTIDFEFDFPHGRDELLGMAYRTDFDLMNIQKASGKSMEYKPKDEGKPFVPHVIEPSFGVERAVMAVPTSAYTEEQVGESDTRIVLKFKPELAPVKVMVSPLLRNKPELVKLARKVFVGTKAKFGAVAWDDNGNIGKRYRRQDEIGTPLCVTIDFDSLEDQAVTVRHRDTMQQTRVKIADLAEHLTQQLANF